jgi:hypothetical protein
MTGTIIVDIWAQARVTFDTGRCKDYRAQKAEDYSTLREPCRSNPTPQSNGIRSWSRATILNREMIDRTAQIVSAEINVGCSMSDVRVQGFTLNSCTGQLQTIDCDASSSLLRCYNENEPDTSMRGQTEKPIKFVRDQLRHQPTVR